jgi:hypothetical protein
VRHTAIGDARTARAEIRYRYTAEEQERVGDRIHFLGVRPGGQRVIEDDLQNYPLGRKVEVFYNPRDPADAALDRTLGGMPLFAALVLLPFNLVTVGGFSWLALRVTGWRSLPLRRQESRWYLLPTNGQPFIVALIVAGVLGIPLIFVIHFGGWAASLIGMLSAWLVLLMLCGAAYWHTLSLVRQERPVLILNDDSATVTWPATEDAPEFSLARSDVLSVEIDDSPPPENGEESHVDFSILLQFAGDDGHTAKRLVFKTHSGTEAAAVADWLEDWTAVPVPSATASNPS